MCEACASGEHLDCDGTVKAPEGEWGWDFCECNCNPQRKAAE